MRLAAFQAHAGDLTGVVDPVRMKQHPSAAGRDTGVQVHHRRITGIDEEGSPDRVEVGIPKLGPRASHDLSGGIDGIGFANGVAAQDAQIGPWVARNAVAPM